MSEHAIDDREGQIEVDVAAETVTYGSNDIGVNVDNAQRQALVGAPGTRQH